MHKLFEKQLSKATRADGTLDFARLSALVSEAYDSNDRSRERTERSIALMVEELEERHMQLEEREAELSLQNQHFRDAIDNMGHGLTMYDAEGRLVVCNTQFIRMYDLQDLDPKPGMHFSQIRQCYFDKNLFKTPIGTFDEISSVGRFFQRELEMADGRVIAIACHRRDSGGLVIMHEDVTEHQLLEQKRSRAEAEARILREQEYKAETANKAKSEFLAMMSHEIRTPLNAVLGLATTLLETSLNADQRMTVELIDSSGNNLLHLLNDILDFSKLEAGKLEFETLPFSPASLIENALSIAKVPAAKKALTLRAEIAPDLPRALIGDADRIRQVIYNLATNAVKFTQSGEVVLGARMIKSNARDATIEWWVRDTGIGISPDKVQRLFKNFMQADNSVSRRFGGTGLGLAICKQIVEQMGGDISVTSHEGQGSTFAFRLTLPLADSTTLAEATPADEIDLGEALARFGRPLRILLAEDNPTNQMVFKKMLEDYAVSIHVASNGLEALEQAQRFNPDIVYMDMRMPEMDGIEATRAIRALGGAFNALPIVALTANAFADDIKLCRDAGMNDFIAKPVRKKLLVSRVAQVVAAMVAEPAGLPNQAAQLTEADSIVLKVPDCDRSILCELAEEIGEDGVEATLTVFFDDTIARVDLLQTLTQKLDRQGIKAEAHTLKGASSIFGFQRMAALAAHLELNAATLSLQDCNHTADLIVDALSAIRKELAAQPVSSRSAA